MATLNSATQDLESTISFLLRELPSEKDTLPSDLTLVPNVDDIFAIYARLSSQTDTFRASARATYKTSAQSLTRLETVALDIVTLLEKCKLDIKYTYRSISTRLTTAFCKLLLDMCESNPPHPFEEMETTCTELISRIEQLLLSYTSYLRITYSVDEESTLTLLSELKAANTAYWSSKHDVLAQNAVAEKLSASLREIAERITPLLAARAAEEGEEDAEHNKAKAERVASLRNALPRLQTDVEIMRAVREEAVVEMVMKKGLRGCEVEEKEGEGWKVGWKNNVKRLMRSAEGRALRKGSKV